MLRTVPNSRTVPSVRNSSVHLCEQCGVPGYVLCTLREEAFKDVCTVPKWKRKAVNCWLWCLLSPLSMDCKDPGRRSATGSYSSACTVRLQLMCRHACHLCWLPVLMYRYYSQLHCFVLNLTVKHLLTDVWCHFNWNFPSLKILLFWVSKLRADKESVRIGLRDF